MKLTLAQVKKLLHIGSEKTDEGDPPIILSVGPKWRDLAKHLQDQASLEHADPRAIKALMVLSNRPRMIAIFFPRSFSENKPAVIYAHGFN